MPSLFGLRDGPCFLAQAVGFLRRRLAGADFSAQLAELAQTKRGLVLATGVAGSGKSTTLASMIEFMNVHLSRHVVTIEDPVEYIFSEQNCIITQREIGHDSSDFKVALKNCMRQAPDVIVLGEMRDQETIEAAISAAESGHLVLSTLHTINAVQTVERILSYFPAEQQALVRMQLSMVLQGVISLRLMNTIDGSGRIPACELLLNTPSVRETVARREAQAPRARCPASAGASGRLSEAGRPGRPPERDDSRAWGARRRGCRVASAAPAL